MTFPATIATVTPINLSSSSIRPSSCPCSRHPSPNNPINRTPNQKSNHFIRSIKTAAAAAASDSTAIVDNPNIESVSEEDEIQAKVGARVRVIVPLKVYHVPKVPELDLNGKEGKLKEYVAVWRGKHISANLPFKIEFFEKLEGRGDAPVKFFAHLKDDEFEFLD